MNKRFITTILVLTFLILWFVLPLPHTLYFTAVTTPVRNQTVYVPLSSRVQAVYVKKGDVVKKDQVLIQLQSLDLDDDIQQIKAEMSVAGRELAQNSILKQGRQLLAGQKEELRALKAKLESLTSLRRSLTVHANIDGVVYDWDNDIKIDQNLQVDTPLGQIAPLDKLKVMAFIPEDKLSDIFVGTKVNFRVSRSLEDFPGVVRTIRPGRDVALQYKQLASVYGGNLPTKQKTGDNKLYLTESYYLADIEILENESGVKIGETGYVDARGPWTSHFMDFVRLVQKVLWRESGL